MQVQRTFADHLVQIVQRGRQLPVVYVHALSRQGVIQLVPLTLVVDRLKRTVQTKVIELPRRREHERQVQLPSCFFILVDHIVHEILRGNPLIANILLQLDDLLLFLAAHALLQDQLLNHVAHLRLLLHHATVLLVKLDAAQKILAPLFQRIHRERHKRLNAAHIGRRLRHLTRVNPLEVRDLEFNWTLTRYDQQVVLLFHVHDALGALLVGVNSRLRNCNVSYLSLLGPMLSPRASLAHQLLIRDQLLQLEGFFG